jgi:hypothetical protein
MSKANPIMPVLHAVEHQDAGNDEISVTGLSGLLADDQHVLDSEVLAVASAKTHAPTHLVGGTDEAIFPNLLCTYFLSIAKTNIGNAYVEIWPAAAFNPINLHSIDFSGIHFIRLVYIVDYVGAGTQRCCLADTADNTKILVEGATFTADVDPGDSGWVALPAWFVNKILKIELMGKSTTAGDDPIYKGFSLYGK